LNSVISPTTKVKRKDAAGGHQAQRLPAKQQPAQSGASPRASSSMASSGMDTRTPTSVAEPVMYQCLGCCLGRQKAGQVKPAMKAGC
jgi:hypothetical protein